MEQSPLVFISHSSKDQAEIMRVIASLRSLGIRYWVSFENLCSEDQFQAISREIDKCDVFLFVWSANSLASHQVAVEIHKAHAVNKAFAIYQIDATKPPLGLDMLVAYKQFRVLPAGLESDRLVKLAKLIYLASGATETAADLAIDNYKKRKALEERRKIDKWVDRFWTYKYDPQRKRVRDLSSFDESRLSQLAKQFGIPEDIQNEYKSNYSRDMRAFYGMVRSALRNQVALNEADILLLEQQRKSCCIPKAEAREIRSKLYSQPLEVAMTSENIKNCQWLIAGAPSDSKNADVLSAAKLAPSKTLVSSTDKPSKIQQSPIGQDTRISPESTDVIETKEESEASGFDLSTTLQATIFIILAAIFLLASLRTAFDIVVWIAKEILGFAVWILSGILKRGAGIA